MAKNPAIGIVNCGDPENCKRRVALRMQTNGRFYANCDGELDPEKRGCGDHHRFSMQYTRKEQLPAYAALVSETRNVTEPEPEAAPEPVTTTPEEEPVTDVRSKKRGGIFAALN